MQIRDLNTTVIQILVVHPAPLCIELLLGLKSFSWDIYNGDDDI